MILYLIRGLPGSGKSTYAKKLNCCHVENDMFSMQNGKYVYDSRLTENARKWCLDMAWYSLRRDMDVVVSNTFTQKSELEPYLMIAHFCKCEIKIITMTGNYGNQHNVPEEILQKMKDQWERIEGEQYI
jgi:predicted kinase